MSGRTFALALVGVTLAALTESLSAAVGGNAYGPAVVLIFEGVFIIATGVAVVFVRLRMTARLNRACWALLGVAVLLPGAADVLWGGAMLSAGEDVGVPWYAFALYVASNVAFAAACAICAIGYRRTVDLTWPAVEATVAVAALGVVAWFLGAGAVRASAPADGGTAASMVWADGAFGILDMVFYVLPALFALLTVLRVGGDGRMRDVDRRLVGPWAFVLAGAVTLTISDLGWYLQRTSQSWVAGSIVDFAYMLGFVCIAIGASAALDAEHALVAEDDAGIIRREG